MTKPIIEIKNLRKSFHQNTAAIEVLKGLELCVEKGDTVAIIGQSGSGKSTLLSMLAGLDYPDSGSILVDQEDIVKMSEQKLASFRGKKLGIVFQQFHLMKHLTAIENIMLPLDISRIKDAKNKAEQALQLVGLQHRATHYPHQLSGGEQQRVAIARAIVIEPALLLADEPSGNLDDGTGEQVMQLLFNLVEQKKMTMILVTHNQDLAARCGRQLKLAQGMLI